MKKNKTLFLLKLISLSMILLFSSCDEEAVSGCTDSTACNFNTNATEDDGSCQPANANEDCEGNCLVELDCFNECGGSAVLDECGLCGGDGSNCENPQATISFGDLGGDA